ncbi:MAG TPA: ceramide glucosyltransferase [Clostridiales bacterium]|nr:ceramide glucosyltransferase [Clostridiales bacterium]
MLLSVFQVLVAASWIYWLTACWLTRAFFRSPLPPRGKPGFTPPVSVLKPVRGVDFEAYENFKSFCLQDYPEYEILFGVDEPDDPVVPVIHRLQRDHPELSIRLVVAKPMGANRKAAVLYQLTSAARHDILVISDSDMRVRPDYLRRVVAPLADRRVGLVTCPYIGEEAHSLPARLEALYMGVTFLPSVIVARRVLSMRFALGASLALRRTDLERIGGYAALVDYLAEDYQVGVRLSALGLKVHLSDYVMTSILGPTTFHEEWDREVRWARASRVSRPREYPGLILSFSTPLAGALAWLSGFSPAAVQALAVSLVLRWAVGWLVSGYTGDRVSRRSLVWLPVRDVLTALVWLAAGIGHHVVWRGEHYELERGGLMRRVTPLSVHFEEGGEEGDVPDGLEDGGEGTRLPPAAGLRHPRVHP